MDLKMISLKDMQILERDRLQEMMKGSVNLKTEEEKEQFYEKSLLERMKENKEVHKMVHDNQRDTLLNHTRKKFKLTDYEAQKLFDDYWEEFTAGVVKSIRDFMIKKGFDYNATQT